MTHSASATAAVSCSVHRGSGATGSCRWEPPDEGLESKLLLGCCIKVLVAASCMQLDVSSIGPQAFSAMQLLVGQLLACIVCISASAKPLLAHPLNYLPCLRLDRIWSALLSRARASCTAISSSDQVLSWAAKIGGAGYQERGAAIGLIAVSCSEAALLLSGTTSGSEVRGSSSITGWYPPLAVPGLP